MPDKKVYVVYYFDKDFSDFMIAGIFSKEADAEDFKARHPEGGLPTTVVVARSMSYVMESLVVTRLRMLGLNLKLVTSRKWAGDIVDENGQPVEIGALWPQGGEDGLRD